MGYAEARRAATDTYRLTRNLNTRLKEVDGYQNPDLNPEGLTKARDAARGRVFAEGKARAAALRKTAQDGYDFAVSRVQEYRPQVKNDSVAELTRSAQAWELIVKPQLEAGKNWFDIIPNADWDTLLAISRFAEPTIKATEPAHEVPIILGNLTRHLDDRAVAIHPDENARVLLDEAKQAREALNAVAMMQTAVDQAYNAQGVNSALIYGMRELHPLGLLPTEQEWSGEDQDAAVRIRNAHNGGPVPDAYRMALSAPDYTPPQP